MRCYLPKIPIWLQRLHLLQDENVRLKNILSDRLKQAISPQQLEHVEDLQTQLINKDAAVSLLRHELALTAMSYSDYEGDYAELADDREAQKMETNILEMEESWNLFKQVFNTVLELSYKA